MESFRRVLEAGADGFEFDVRRSGDGKLVVIHDPRCGTRFVSRTPYERLRETRRGANMPLFEDVLREFGGAWLDIELKVAGIEEQVMELAARYCRPGRYVLTCFSRGVVARLRELDAAAPVGWLLRHPVARERWADLRLTYLVPHFTALRRSLVEAAQRDGLPLITWTVNSPRVVARAVGLRVQVVISDFPDLVLKQLAADGTITSSARP